MIILFVIRQIYSVVVNIFFVPVYFLMTKVLIFTKLSKVYKVNKSSYTNISSIAELCEWFKETYKYKYDGPAGAFDHDNSEWEFFSSFGDCDDVANYARKKIKAFGIPAIRVFLDNPNSLKTAFFSAHMDCFYILQEKCYLFNYGSPIEGKTLNECFLKFQGLRKEYKNGIIKIFPF